MSVCFSALTILGLCLGQGCPTPPAQSYSSPIPEGVYSGSWNVELKLYLDTEVIDEDTGSSIDSKIFDANGLPLSGTNQPIYIGYAEYVDLGGIDMEMTITDINTDSSGITVIYDVLVQIAVGTDVITLSGTATDTYTLQEDDSIDYLSEISVGATTDKGSVRLEADATGTYSK
jgi:hypothetical protein